MATERSVLVRLKASTSDFVAGMTTAQAAVRGLTKEIDTTNDRTAWLAQSILALGPALVPLGAAGVPILSGLATQMMLTAGAAGTAALAFSGVGDALGAVNDYQLEPTAANLEKMNQALAKIGPDGAEFVAFLDAIGPKFTDLQMAAREGMFPGVQDGLTSFLDVLPRVQTVVSGLAEAMGELTRQAGAGLSGEGFADFFDYLERDAKPLLIEMGQTIGNFVEGLGAMLVAFQPLTQGFSEGFLEMSRSFSDWAHGLDDSASFQEFVDYVQQSIPKALDTLGALSDAFVSLLTAAAPVGDVMLPVLELLFDAMSVFLDSPLGPVFLGIAAAMSVYGRAAALVAITTGGLGKTLTGLGMSALSSSAGIKTLGADLGVLARNAIVANTATEQLAVNAAGKNIRATAIGMGKAAGAAGLLAVAMSDLDDKAGLTNTTMGAMLGMIGGPWGVAVGAAIGGFLDLKAAAGQTAEEVDRVFQIIATGTREQLLDQKAQLKASLADPGMFADTDALRYALDSVNAALNRGPGTADLMGNAIGKTGEQMRRASEDAQALATQLTILEGFFDKRATMRAYEESVDNLGDALRDGAEDWRKSTVAGRDNLAALDANVTAMLSAADQIKNKRLRRSFLTDARDQLIAFKKQFPAAAGAIDDILAELEEKLDGFGKPRKPATPEVNDKPARDKIDKTTRALDDLGSQRPTPKIDADDKPAKDKINSTNRLLADLSGTTARPRVDVTSNAAAVAAAANAWLNNIGDEDVFINIRTRRTTEGAGTGFGPSAVGNIFPSVRRNAYGDIADRHQPELAGPGVTRVWREPETQGEAYIPLANDDRRPRARSIAEQTVELLGGAVMWNARGNLLASRGAGTSAPMSAPSVSVGGASVHVFIDGNEVRAIVSEEIAADGRHQRVKAGR